MGTHQEWDISNLKDNNTNITNLKLVEKLLLQGLFQRLDVCISIAEKYVTSDWVSFSFQSHEK